MVTKKQIQDIEKWIKEQEKDESMHRLVSGVGKDFGLIHMPNGLGEIQIKIEMDKEGWERKYKNKEARHSSQV